jgi:NrS-1  polymerase HBD domain
MTHNASIPDGVPEDKSADQRLPKPIPLPVIVDQIPDDLKALKQWVCWRWTWDSDRDEWTKVPLNPRTGNKASSTNPKTWTSFDFALSRYQESQDQSWHFDGIGLVLRPENDLVGFDPDNCRNAETGEIAPWALKIVEQVHTYWEISTSGTGLRGLAFGRKPGSRCRAGDFEMYTHGRYLCITGHHLDGTPTTLEPVQNAIDTIYAEMFPTQERQTSGNGHSPHAEDEAIIAHLKRMANAEKFCRLFDDGDISISPYHGDHSIADQGLCRLIAFRTQDPDQVDRIFRLSALCRGKWESRADYRDRTIARAITHVRDRYQGVSVESNGQPTEEPHSSEDRDIGDDQQEAEQEIHEDPKYKPIGPYLIKWSLAKGNALYYRKPGTTDDQILANFMAWITEERLEDDGAESVRMVTMEATLTSGKQFPEIKIAVSEFYSLAGLMKALGTEAVVSPGPMVKDRIRHAIQLFSNRQKYPQRHVFTHLGWRKVDGVWCYLHAGGSVPAKAEVSVDKALQRYILPQTTSAQAAIKASLQVLECAPKRLTIPLLSMVYLAPLAEWLEPDVTGWLEGPSGAQKSSLVALIMCHYGHFSRVHPPDTWESTANTLERLAFLAKDILLWIDDYAPQPSAKEMHEQERKAQRVIRAQGNLSGRGRMRADTSLRPQYYPRGVILSTGELHPTGTSTFARLLQLDVAKGDISLERLTTSQAESHLFAEAMAAYVDWLQPQLDTLPSILKVRWNELRTDALPRLAHHSRHPEVYAHLATAWDLFLKYACESGAIDEAERQSYWSIGSETLMNAINRQQLDAEAEDPVYRFCSHIKEALIQGKAYLEKEALIQGKAYLEGVSGAYPDDAGQWGWLPFIAHHTDGAVSDEWKPSPGAAMLGWVDQDFLYLLPDAAYRLVFENLQRAGILLLPQQALWKRLVDRGYAQRSDNRYTTRKRTAGGNHRVLKLTRSCVEDHLPPESGNSGNSGNDAT